MRACDAESERRGPLPLQPQDSLHCQNGERERSQLNREIGRVPSDSSALSRRIRNDDRDSPAEAARLLDALPAEDQALWATAAYAGLRLGEVRALRYEDVDLESGVIRVERSWDQKAGVIEPKSRAGPRTVPIVAALRSHLAAHLLRSTTREGLIFGRASDEPFNPSTANARAAKAWKGGESIGLHELRHTVDTPAERIPAASGV